MSWRTKTSIWTFFTGELFTVASLGVALVATPLLLRWLGDEKFVAFETATDWIGYVGLLECGIGEAIQALLARSFAHRDPASRRAILNASLRLYCWVALVMIAIGLAVTPFM